MTASPVALRLATDPRQSAMARDVLAGLRATPKVVSPKYFYDAVGAHLFEAITQLPEYYPTRTELSILRTHAQDIAAAIGPSSALVEFGSGAAIKVRLLLDALDQPTAYIPIDISAEQLARVSRERRREYPGLSVLPVCADYTARFTLPPLVAGARRIAFFPGSTIGNFHPAEATAFLGRVRDMVGPAGAMLLGVDRRKDPRVLHAAYNDAAGVTAEFNLNLLARFNRELEGEFDLEGFAHRAFFNDAQSRIEMHLESLRDQVVWVAGTRVAFTRGETIHTENSYKYDADRLAALVEPAGFRLTRAWTDPNDWFWVVLLEPATSR
jgi:L-histidine Nalpha-methyltransferase